MIRRPPRSTQSRSSAASDVYKRQVIHAVGPVWNGGQAGEDQPLASCYVSPIDLCQSQGLASIAFPAISTGVYRFPPGRAAAIAVASTIAASVSYTHLRAHETRHDLVCRLLLE